MVQGSNGLGVVVARTSLKFKLLATHRPRSVAAGFILGYVLFALAVLAVTTYATTQLIGKQDNAKWLATIKDKIEDQAVVVMTQLSACATLNEVDSVEDYGASYPDGAGVNVSSLICPGTSATIWDSGAGSYAPPRLSGFSEWKYFKAVSGSSVTVNFYLIADDAQGKLALTSVRRRLGSGQVSLSQTNSLSDTMVVNILQ